MALLELTNVTKSFGGLRAVHDVDLTLEKKQIVGLIGPNGAGKTTLFNLISGFLKPERGNIYYKKMNIEGLKPHMISKLGVGRTFQTPKSFRSLTVIENVMVGSFSINTNLKKAQHSAIEVLQFLKMGDRMDQLTSDLTLADQKKVEVARALATKPDLLLLDEVVNGLTSTEIQEMIEVLRLVRSAGVTLFIIEHVMHVIMSLSDWIVILHHGEKISEGIPAEVAADEKVIKAYLGEEYALS